MPACSVPDGFARFDDDDLVAPPLMWSEARSALHRLVWRGVVTEATGRRALERLEQSRVRSRLHPRLGVATWEMASALGWAKTYDAEYLALASLLGCRLVTLDARLARAAGRLGIAVAAI